MIKDSFCSNENKKKKNEEEKKKQQHPGSRGSLQAASVFNPVKTAPGPGL